MVLFTWIGFVHEASARGYEDNQSQLNGNGCFSGHGTKFCESDYGFLGLKVWMSQKDQNIFNSIFEKNGMDVPQNICKERVIDYNLTKTNSSMTLTVKCNN